MAKLATMGVEREDIGQIIIFAPPKNDQTHTSPMMHGKANFVPSIPSGEWVDDGVYRFQAIENEWGRFVQIFQSNGEPIRDTLGNDLTFRHYYYQRLDERWEWQNHIAATVLVETPEGMQRMIIDPGTSVDVISPQKWKDAQNCPEAVLVHVGKDGAHRLLPEPEQDDGGRATIAAIAQTCNCNDPYGKDEAVIIKRLAGAYFDCWPHTTAPERALAYYREVLKPLVALQRAFGGNPSIHHEPARSVPDGIPTNLAL